MLFNSIEFAFFLPILFLLYWVVTSRNLKAQNILLLIASYVFYGWWDWRFLILLVLLSLINYFIGIEIESNEKSRKGKIWLMAGLFINIGVLCVFKYFNFFIDSFIDLLSLVGYDLPVSTTRIILPVGISFYIFISLSYLFDVYKKTINAHKKIFEVLLCFGFFPIILAGPIQRPSKLIPQITKKREFSYDQAVDGLRQILWGLFSKVAIADNLGVYVNDLFANYSNYSGSALLVGAVFYAIQIYADFSGYSNIAIGTAKLFGFSLMRNFAFPYFSRDITEFWKRWHISLTTWFRDYLFLPLSFAFSWRIKGEKVLFIKTDLFIYIIVSIIVWFLTGLWHGANYTYILWGTINGFLLIIYHIQRNPRKKLFKRLGINNDYIVVKAFETIVTLFTIVLTWIFFRADSIGTAMNYISLIFSKSLFSVPHFAGMKQSLTVSILIILFILIEWHGREQQFAIARLGLNLKRPFRYAIYFAFIIAILSFSGKEQQFIYFQF